MLIQKAPDPILPGVETTQVSNEEYQVELQGLALAMVAVADQEEEDTENNPLSYCLNEIQIAP